MALASEDSAPRPDAALVEICAELLAEPSPALSERERRPCRYCSGPVGSNVPGCFACARRRCQLARRAEKQREVRRRIRDALRIGAEEYQPTPATTRTCARCDRTTRSRNRLLCGSCFRNDDRAR